MNELRCLNSKVESGIWRVLYKDLTGRRSRSLEIRIVWKQITGRALISINLILFFFDLSVVITAIEVYKQLGFEVK